LQKEGPIDPEKWEQYKEFGREQVRHGRYDLEHVSMRRAASDYGLMFANARYNFVHKVASGQLDRYAIMPTSIIDRGGYLKDMIPVGYLVAPIGAYGAEFHTRLLRGAGYLIDTIEESLVPLSESVGEQHADVLRAFTARGKPDEGRGDAEGLRRTMQEGVRTTMEAMTILTAEKVGGYETGDDLLEAIVQQGLVEQLARAMPLGVTGPMAFTGKYIPGLVQSDAKGNLSLNIEAVDAMRAVKNRSQANIVGGWTVYWSEYVTDDRRKNMIPPDDFGLMCPAAFAHGAVEMTSKLLLKTVRKPEIE